MINLDRNKQNRWIFQKNINSSEIILEYLFLLTKNSENLHFNSLKENLKLKGLYKGRSEEGSMSTMGVRLSEMCFYMFGYHLNLNKRKLFIPSPTSTNILDANDIETISKNVLINLFSMQFPHPFSKTLPDFNIFIGRLIIKLLLEHRIDQILYLDEIIWFLPFIKTINESSYEELVNSIIEYRKLTYFDKKKLFESVKDYNDVFANVLHEFKYYFLTIFSSFGIFDLICDEKHNDGKLFKFIHGKGTTTRTDSYKSHSQYSGFIKLCGHIYEFAEILSNNFSVFEKPLSENNELFTTYRDWLIHLYEVEPLKYINCLSLETGRLHEISKIINNMIRESKYGSRDGSSFEQSLEPVLKLFEQTIDVEIRSGSGNTDLVCVIDDNEEKIKINVEAKTRKNSLEEVNSRRIVNHLQKHGSKFCLIIAPRFAKGAIEDIKNHNIVLLNSDDFGNYCFKECQISKNGFANFHPLLKIIINNLGKNITNEVREYLDNKFGSFI